MSRLPVIRSSTAPALPARRKSNLREWVGQVIRLSDSKFWGGFFGGEAWAGEPVTAMTAMQISAVFRAVRLGAETVSTLPFQCFRDTPEGPERVIGSQTDVLIRESPNQEQTPEEFWEQMTGCMDLVGDGVALKHTIGQRLVAMDPLDPLRMDVVRNVQGGVEYRYTDLRGQLKIYGPLEVFHLKGFSLGGLRGMSTVSYGAQGMSLARAAEKTAGKLFKSGLRNSGFIQTGQVLNDPDRVRLDGIVKEYMGADKAGGVMLLEGGMTFQNMTMSSQDAELLLTRRFQIEEIGRWFGMPPILLGHAVDGQTMWGSGVDSIIQAWLTLGLRQKLRRIESATKKRVMSSQERAAGHYVKYNPDALLAINSASRAAFLSTMVQNGLLTRDEGRDLLERGKIPGGDVATAQVNLVPLGQLGQTSQTTAVRSALRTFLGIEDQTIEPAGPADP